MHYSEQQLDSYGLEITDAEFQEVALIVDGDLFGVYDTNYDIDYLEDDVDRLMQERVV